MPSQKHLDSFSQNHSSLTPPSQNQLITHLLWKKRPPFHGRLFWFTCLGLLLLVLNVWSTIFSTPQAFASTVRQPVVLKGAPSKPNRISPTAGSTSSTPVYHPAPEGSAPIGKPQALVHPMSTTMKPAALALQTNRATQFLASDRHIEVSVPATAITTQDLQQAGGKLTVRVTQIAPSSGSNAGGSGHLSLGTYLFQLVDANGVLATHGLRTPITVTYHYSKDEEGLNLDHAYVVQNGSRPTQGVAFAAMKANVSLASTFGAPSSQGVQFNKAQSTLVATPLINTPSTTLSWQSDASIGTFGKPDPFNVDLSAGGLTSQLPIDVPAGPGGLTPPVSLNYSSEGVNSQHNPTGATGWVGEGWNLSMGSIDWAEHNVYAGCFTTSCAGGVNWENTWELSDPYGTSSELIPPNINVSTYYDDSTNKYCDATTGTATPYPCPILWHTATETHTKIYAYVGPNSLPDQTAKPPCFRVWLANGTMEEFGCTPDSLQHYYQASVGAHLVSSWLLDMITDPQGNQIHFTYQQDATTVAGTHQAIRDVALSTIEYDSPKCHNAQTMCTGSSWNPLMRISFQASHAPRLSGVVPSGCNTGANLRCDDPLDLSSSKGIAAPEVKSTFVLNDILVQVRASSSASWNTLHDYQLGYEESGPSTITDPATGLPESTAGMLDLTQFQDLGSTGANALVYAGLDNNATTSHAYMKVFDLSSKNIVVGSNTTLSYWVYPQSNATSNLVSGSNSTCVAVDMIFSDGSNLRDSGAVDQHGNKLHPASQCGHLTMNQWNLVTSNIGAVRSGKTISRIDIGYDQGANTGGYRGYIDDISLSDPSSTTPLFATGLESGETQPTWTDTVDTGPEVGAGNISNVGGICCGLSAPQLGVRQEVVHADVAALPMRTFTYTTLTNYYEDDQFTSNTKTNCGPSWNTGNGSGCLLWSKSYANNNRFLTTASNGQGMQQTFSWAVARSNTHGVPGGGSNNADPLYCNAHQSGYPCNEADDQSWSHVILTATKDSTVRLTQSGQGGAQTSTPIDATTGYSYLLTYPLGAQQCSDCVAGFYWGNQNDTDYLSYYNNKFMGFTQTTVTLPDSAKEVHKYYATGGVGIYDTSQVSCFAPHPCHASPWWALGNAAHGHEYQALYYDTDGTTLLKQTDNSYKAVCPPAGVAATPASTDAGKTYTWDGNLVSELDHNNPVAVCDVQQTQSVSQVKDGASNSVTTTTAATYDTYGRVTKETTTSNGGTPSQVVKNTSYVWNDGVTATRTSATGTYIIDTPAFEDTEDGAGNRLGCTYTGYDGKSYVTGQTGNLTGGQATSDTSYSNCGTSSNGYAPSGASTTTTAYDTYGNTVGSSDADANAGISGHTGCAVGSTQYTGCSAYDSTFDAFQASATNALNQSASTSYANTTASFGYGTWPVSATDANKQTTNVNYDFLGRMTGESLPGETSGLLTHQWAYSNWCSGTAAQAPCEEIDQIDRLNDSTTTVTRAFYDGDGRLMETRAPGPGSQDIVTYAYYDTMGRQIFKSNSYFVAAYTGVSGPAAYAIPDSTQPGTTTVYTNQRQTSVTDPNSHTTKSTDSVVCSVAGTSDTGCYGQTMVVDANGHAAATLTGGLGKTNYKQTYTGSSTYTLYATTAMSYNAAGDLLSTKSPDGSTVTTTYDALGHATNQNDPDSGSATASYDPNGNVTETVDARGSAGTVYAGYDGLNRQLWHNSTNTPTGAWVTYSYDSTANGNDGVGQLTSESFTGSGNLSGSYAYTYDGRGEQISNSETINGSSYTVQGTYNDAGQPLTETYPTGETVTPGYTSTGWLNGLSTSAGGTTILASNLVYSGLAGAAGKIGSMSLGNGTYTDTASYDTGMRLTSEGLSNVSSGTQLYQTQPTYDAVSNVVGVQTSVGGQTDTQQFCDDDLNRLTWSGTNGTPPCSGTSITAGTLTAAQYQQSESYNVDGGLVSGPAGSYTYGDSAHPHGVTSTSSGYGAAYDAAGNLICRSLTTATTCSGSSPTGQQLSYDAQGRLSIWQSQPTSPTQTVNYLYDGSGSRVAMQSTVNGTTTLTSYIGSIEEVQSSGSSTQTTTYYAVGGKRVAADVNGTFYYFGYDALGSQVAVLNASGSLVGAQLYGPYGASRYNTGTLPTSIGFTGQRADSVTGLDYYGARYYDPTVGQFVSVDGVQGNAVGMDPYAYVGGNPESRIDPSGNVPTCPTGPQGCDPGGTGGVGRDGGNGGGSTNGGGSGSGTSGGSGTGGGTSPTKPSGGGTCGKLTASECSQAQASLKQRTADLNRQKGIIALIASFIPLVFDAIPLVKDIIDMAKSFSLKKLFETIGDGIPVFLDISATISKLVALTGWQNIAWLADGVSAVASALSGAYKVIKGILDNRWLSTLADAGGWIVEGLTTLFTGGGTEALMIGLGAVADGIWDKVKESVEGKDVVGIAGNLASSWISSTQTQIDTCNTTSLEQYYYQGC